MELSASWFLERGGHQWTLSLPEPPKSSCGEQGEQKREGRCLCALLHTGETATAGLSLHGHSSETGGLPCSVFIVTVLTLENTAVGQW